MFWFYDVDDLPLSVIAELCDAVAYAYGDRCELDEGERWALTIRFVRPDVRLLDEHPDEHTLRLWARLRKH